MKNGKRYWKKLFVVILAAVVLCSTDSVSMIVKAVQENGGQTENSFKTAAQEVKELWVHCRAVSKVWKPNMDVSDEYMRSVIDFNVLYGGSADELVQNYYQIQWIAEDGTVLSGIPENAGTYTVKVILDECLSQTAKMAQGKDSFTFIIRKMNFANAIIGLYGTMPEWTGEPVLPKEPYLANSDYRLPKENYELQFVDEKNCVEPGRGYVKAVAKGPNVEGEKEFSYQINKAQMNLIPFQEAVEKEFIYDGTGKHPVLEGTFEEVKEIKYGNYYDSDFNRLEGMPEDTGNYKCYIDLIPEDSVHYYNGRWYQDYTITPRKLEADVQVEKRKVYDTGTGVKTSETTVLNLVPGDEVALSSLAEYDTKQVGKNKTISVSFALRGKDARNYTAPDGFTLTDGEIVPKEVQAQNIVLQSYFYNGSREVPLDDTAVTDKNHWALTGVYSSVDDVALDHSQAKAYMADANVGEKKPVTFTGLKLMGADSGNYFLDQPQAAVTIRRILFSDAIRVEMPDYQYGNVIPEPFLLNYKGDGEITYKFRKGDSDEEYREWKEIGPQTLMPGKYEMIAEVTDTINVQGGLTVYPAEFYVNWLSPELTGTQNWEKTYGGEPFYLDAVHKGDGQLRYQVSQGEDILSVDNDGKVTVKKPGEAIVQVIFDKTMLYRADSISVKISVAKATGSASVSQEGWEYHPQNSNAKLPVPVSETNGTDHVAYLYKAKDDADNTYTDEIPVNAGEYTVKAIFAETENYHEISAEADFTITKAQAQITGMNYYLKRYGDEAFALNLSKTGDGDLMYEVTSGAEVVEIKEGGMVTVQKTGTAYITVFMAATNNYEAVNTEVQIIVSRGQGTGSVKLEDWIYSPDKGNANLPQPVSETNGTDHVSYFYKAKDAGDESYTTEIPVNAGVYTVKAVFAETEYYLEAEAAADFQILKKENPENMPASNSITISAGAENQVKDIELPDGWFWKNTDIELIPGGIITAEAVYEDNANYEQYQVQIKLSKMAELIASATDREYIIGKDATAVIQCTGALSELKSVEVDQAKIDDSNYLLEEGSTILLFQKTYLDTLSIGNHIVRLCYTAGNVESVLTVKKQNNEDGGTEPGGENLGEVPGDENPGENPGETPGNENPGENPGETPEDENPGANSENKHPVVKPIDQTPESQVLDKKPNVRIPVSQTPDNQRQDVSDSRTEHTDRPVTGDSAPLKLYLLLLLFSAGSAVFIWKKRKKQQ
ncbi:MAG: hypothetical protein HFI69_03285 [Lachnospiraceae bacterium]|nr:hypothetical protein [Lachnospiraceae bacterium]